MAVELLPERNCATCTARQKIQWGCEGDAKLPIELDGEEQTTCPRRPILDDPALYEELFWLYRSYAKGMLPEEGSILSQPAKLVQAISIMDLTLDGVNAHKRETEARNRARAARGGH